MDNRSGVDAPKAFVIGHPISHSLSPVLHGFWLQDHQIDGSYAPHDVAPDDLPDFIKRLRHREFVGGNVTLPHKEAVADLVDDLTPSATAIGAVNTLYFDGKRLIGDNTDAYGFLANLDDHGTRWRQGKKALILGAGGAAAAIVYAVQEAGFDEIVIANRTLARGENLAGRFDARVTAIALGETASAVSSADLIVNTTSLGMAGHGSASRGLPVDFALAKQTALITDIVYTPLETPFLKVAKQHGLQTVDGLGMLLHQAKPGFERWFGGSVHVNDKLRQTVLDTLSHNSDG